MEELSALSLLGIALYHLTYQESFGWITAVSANAMVLAYGYGAEMHVLKTSLPLIREWSWHMWSLLSFMIVAVAGFAVDHVYYAVGVWGPTVALGGYLGSFLLAPVFISVLVISVSRLSNETRQHLQVQVPPENQHDGMDEVAEDEAMIPADQTRKGLIKIHLHHYQLFGYLALFTRWRTISSQLAAGLCLGSMVHGIAAYGVDSIFEMVVE